VLGKVTIHEKFCRDSVANNYFSGIVACMNVKEIIQRLGGPTRVAMQLNIIPQAVSHWVREDKVPPARVPTVVRLGKEIGLEIKPSMLNSDVDWDAIR
jgi:DNA-binding transcriptional regulator YdaS (Cro superfamily)